MKLEDAEKAVEERKAKVISRYRPSFHAAAPEGWINDPNGFVYFDGKIHLYYQFNPYDSAWGNMHWGHWCSTDFVTWKDEPVAIAPDMPYDNRGIFSGTSLVENGRLYVMYTGVCRDDETGKDFQQQCMAVSDDGISFRKFDDNPVIGKELLPEGFSPYDFRDPKLEKTAEGYMATMAVRGADGGYLVSYVSKDMHSWKFDRLYLGPTVGMTECPDKFKLGGKNAALFCLCDLDEKKYGTKSVSVYELGSEQDGKFVASGGMIPVDAGFDFYAPETTLMPDGRRILVGWAQHWGNVYASHTLHHGWAGMMNLPRELSVEDGQLRQWPIREIQCYRQNHHHISAEISEKKNIPECKGKRKEICISVDMTSASLFTMNVMESGREHLTLTYDKAAETFTINRGGCGYPPTENCLPEEKPWASTKAALENGKLNLQIFVDNSMAEVFLQDGRQVMSVLAFPENDDYCVSMEAEGAADVSIECYDIKGDKQ